MSSYEVETEQFIYSKSLGRGGHVKCKGCGEVKWWFSGSGAEQDFWMRDHQCGGPA